jgi:hypothetical protein
MAELDDIPIDITIPGSPDDPRTQTAPDAPGSWDCAEPRRPAPSVLVTTRRELEMTIDATHWRQAAAWQGWRSTRALRRRPASRR